MALQKVSSPAVYTSQYNNLKGADFSVANTDVSRYRSPDTINMISDDGGDPIKRKGYRKVYENSDGIYSIKEHNGDIYYVSQNDSGYSVIRVVDGNWEQQIKIVSTSTDTIPLLLEYNGNLYIKYGSKFRIINRGMLSNEEPYVPLVTIGLSADGSGGTTLYDINVLTRARTYSYNFNNGIEANTEVWLFPVGNRNQKIFLKVANNAHVDINVEYMDATINDWMKLEYNVDFTVSGTSPNVSALDESRVEFTAQFCSPMITVLNELNIVTGLNRDNFRITFKPFDDSICEDLYPPKPSVVPGWDDYYEVNLDNAKVSNSTVFKLYDWKMPQYPMLLYNLRNDEHYDLYMYDPNPFGKMVRVGLVSKRVMTYNGIDYDVKSGTMPNGGNGYYVKISDFCVPSAPYESIAYMKVNDSGDELLVDVVRSSSVRNGLYSQKLADLMSATSIRAYGYSSFNRLFFAGGNLGNNVYYTDADNPMYVPDVNYVVIGNDDNSVAGLHRKGQYLCAIKENEGTEPTMFLINGALTTMDNEEYEFFKVTSTSANVGAYNTKCFATLIDDPLFLSKAGIYGISSITTTSETVLRERSTLLNRKLLKEPNMDKAVAFSYDSYYIVICPNGHAYVLDGRQATTANTNGNTDFVYEGYYWEGLPENVTAVMSTPDSVLMGTADGKIYKFNTDIEGNEAYNDDGRPIKARWSTPLDGEYRPHYLKTLQKKGTMVTLHPYETTSCRVTLVKDGTDRYELDEFHNAVNGIDFSNADNFLYNFYEVASDMYLKKKLKKYKRMQVVVENANLNEPFGVQEIIKSYTLNSYAKK